VCLSTSWTGDRPLRHRKGAMTRLIGIDVYRELARALFRTGEPGFRNGQCLAHRIVTDCPEGKTLRAGCITLPRPHGHLSSITWKFDFISELNLSYTMSAESG
jgi:hypothetical protein